jgi:hypothetical protein
MAARVLYRQMLTSPKRLVDRQPVVAAPQKSEEAPVIVSLRMAALGPCGVMLADGGTGAVGDPLEYVEKPFSAARHRLGPAQSISR